MINKDIILLGAPGAGKGTMANVLVNHHHYVHISTGEIFRTEIRKKTSLGLQIAAIIEKGGYVDDEITNQIVANKIQEIKTNQQHFILDGYPRTLNQAKFLATITNNYQNIITILIEIDTEVLVKRLEKRRFCPFCQKTYHLQYSPSKNGEYCELHFEDNPTLIVKRKDDEPEAINHRLDIYNELTKPLIHYYEDKNIIKRLNNLDSNDIIISKIEKAIND